MSSILAQISQAARHLDEIADARRGRVIVGSHLVGANPLLPRAIAAFKSVSPLATVVVDAQHTLADGATVCSEDLCAHPWILPGPETALRRELEEQLVRRRIGERLRVLDIDFAGIGQTVGATTSAGRHLDPASLAFISCLDGVAGPLDVAAAGPRATIQSAEAGEWVAP